MYQNMSLDVHKRLRNERKFENWSELADGGRRYCYDVAGKHGWWARYVKEVDENETTLRFWQEIYDSTDTLVERHDKYPIDTGHYSPGESTNDCHTG